ncbi:hypothetical protein OF377_03075 [Ureaplasma sp. ES3154-GEN]|uniref:Vmc-like lipoprotein signal peptide domain-containing protein n=1 Tax=Ureaplasma sp. ES3154-GEN TaxID=2984844 RepID=UPI0021E8BDAF|nr:hypothetical protein [Ureaplasma sp. ES3154-GEN]MCV3743843.1 hypothetical protein [Ureaplasma sp. ES3154-GEN]
MKLKKTNKRLLIASLSSIALISAVSAVAASCSKNTDATANWSELNKQTIITYNNAPNTEFANVPNSLNKTLFTFSNSNVGVSIEYVAATKETNKIVVKYQLKKESKISAVLTKEISAESFKHDHNHAHDHGDEHDHEHNHGTDNNTENETNTPSQSGDSNSSSGTSNSDQPAQPEDTPVVDREVSLMGSVVSLNNKELKQTTLSYISLSKGFVRFVTSSSTNEPDYVLHLGLTFRNNAFVKVYLKEVNANNEAIGDLIPATRNAQVEQGTLSAHFSNIDVNKKYTVAKVEIFKNERDATPFETIESNDLPGFKVYAGSYNEKMLNSNVYLDDQHVNLYRRRNGNYALTLRLDNPSAFYGKSFSVRVGTNDKFIGLNDTSDEDDLYSSSETNVDSDGNLIVYFTRSGLAYESSPKRYYIKYIQVKDSNGEDDNESKQPKINVKTLDAKPFLSAVRLRKEDLDKEEIEYLKSNNVWYNYEKIKTLTLPEYGELHVDDLEPNYFNRLTLGQLNSGSVSEEVIKDQKASHSFNLRLRMLDKDNNRLINLSQDSYMVIETVEYDEDGYRTHKPHVFSEPMQIKSSGRFLLEFHGKRSYDGAVKTDLMTQDRYYKIVGVKFYSDYNKTQELTNVDFSSLNGIYLTTINSYNKIPNFNAVDFSDEYNPNEEGYNPNEKPDSTSGSNDTNPSTGESTTPKQPSNENQENNAGSVENAPTPRGVFGENYNTGTWTKTSDSIKITLNNVNINLNAIKKVFESDGTELDSLNFPIVFKFQISYTNDEGTSSTAFGLAKATNATDPLVITIDKSNAADNTQFTFDWVLLMDKENEEEAEFVNLDIRQTLNITKA